MQPIGVVDCISAAACVRWPTSWAHASFERTRGVTRLGHPRTRNAPPVATYRPAARPTLISTPTTPSDGPDPPTRIAAARSIAYRRARHDRANSSIPRFFLSPPNREGDADGRDEVSCALLSLEAKQAYSRYRICYLIQINRHYFVIK